MTEGGSSPVPFGLLSTAGGRGTVRFELVFVASAEAAWAALTEPAELRRWIAEVGEMPTIGAPFEIEFLDEWEVTCILERCLPLSRLTVVTDPGPAETVIDARVSEATDASGQGVRLVIEERSIQLQHLALTAASWHARLDALVAHLANAPVTDWDRRRQEVLPAYEELAARLG